MKSKTLISKQARNKTNTELVKTILECKKNDKWTEVASILSMPRRMKTALNLDTINEATKEGDTVLIPGKVLSAGDIDKKVRVVAVAFSDGAREKLKKTKSEIVSVLEELKINPKFQGVKILR